MSEAEWHARISRHGERDYWTLAFTQDGERAIGEGTAMPGYSPETMLEQTNSVVALLDARPSLPGLSVGDVSRALQDLPLTPAVRFGAETAMARWAATRSETRLSRWWGADAPVHVTCNGLIPRGLDDARAAQTARELANQFAVEQAARHDNSGSATPPICLKIKVDGTASDAARVRAIAAAVPDARLRLDANAGWTSAHASTFFSALGDESIEYCEQPLAPTAPPPLRLGCRIALDETLRHLDVTAQWLGCDSELLRRYLWGDGSLPMVQPHPELSTLVLKPTVLGGAAICLRWGALARAASLSVVMTHTFEGPIGLAACRASALANVGGDTPQGLARYAALDERTPKTGHLFPATFGEDSVEKALAVADSARV